MKRQQVINMISCSFKGLTSIEGNAPKKKSCHKVKDQIKKTLKMIHTQNDLY